MGCGASVQNELGGKDSTRGAKGGLWGMTPSSASTKSSETVLGDQPEVPDGIVLCTATRPDWNHEDYLVFESKDHMAKLLGTYEERPGSGDRSNLGDTLSTSMSSKSVTSTKSTQDLDKGGRFFSKRQDCTGTWRIMGNVLTLVWPGTMRTDTVVCRKDPRQWVNSQTNFTLNIVEPTEIPSWFAPDLIADKFQSASISAKAFECPVCYFELYKFPAGVIRLHSRRCCGHYFHKDCAHYLLRAMKGSGRSAVCPLCGVSFSEVKLMPDLAKDPRDWFAVCDVDFGGELDAYEVVEALGCVLPVNRHKLEKNVKAHWHEWDPDGDGTITLQEFIQPVRGLKDWILANLNLLAAKKFEGGQVPSIDRNPREWFHYWDRDGSGTLEKDEVVRALIRTFCRDENGHPHLPSAHDMREVAATLWEAMGYSPFDCVNFEEFVRPFGLMDQFLHNQTHTAFFGVDAERVA